MFSDMAMGQDTAQSLLVDVLGYLPKHYWWELIPKEHNTCLSITDALKLPRLVFEELLVKAGVCSGRNRWGPCFHEQGWMLIKNLLGRKFKHGTYRRTIFISHLQSDQYKDPKDQIKAKARYSFKLNPLPPHILMRLKEFGASIDAIDNTNERECSGMKRDCLDGCLMGIDKKLKMNPANQSFSASYPLLSSVLDFEGDMPDQMELERVMNQLIAEFNELNKKMNAGLMLEEAKENEKPAVSPTPRKASKCLNVNVIHMKYKSSLYFYFICLEIKV